MKTRKGILVVAAILVFCASTVLADGVTYRSTRVGKILVYVLQQGKQMPYGVQGFKTFHGICCRRLGPIHSTSP